MQFLRRHYYLVFSLLAGPITALAVHPITTKACDAVETWGR